MKPTTVAIYAPAPASRLLLQESVRLLNQFRISYQSFKTIHALSKSLQKNPYSLLVAAHVDLDDFERLAVSSKRVPSLVTVATLDQRRRISDLEIPAFEPSRGFPLNILGPIDTHQAAWLIAYRLRSIRPDLNAYFEILKHRASSVGARYRPYSERSKNS